MSATTITVHIKNMAGDLLPMEVPIGTKNEALIQRLTTLYSSLYPRHRTHIFRSDNGEDEKKAKHPLEDGEIIVAFVSEGAVKETGIFGDEPWVFKEWRGKSYTRFRVPIGDVYLYVYALSVPMIAGSARQCYYRVSLSPYPFTRGAAEVDGYVLYRLVVHLLPEVTPEEMKVLYDIVESYYEELSCEDNIKYNHSYAMDEPVACDCGVLVQRSAMPPHCKTKRHRTRLFLP